MELIKNVKKQQKRDAVKPIPVKRTKIAERLRGLEDWNTRNRALKSKADNSTLAKNFIRKGRPTLLVSPSRKPFVGNLKQRFKFGPAFSNKDRRKMVMPWVKNKAKAVEDSTGKTLKRKRLIRRIWNWIVSLFKKKSNAGSNS